MNGYELSRGWFDFAFVNPDKITPVHGVLYLFIVEHCNRMGWKEKFGLPTTMAKEAIGVRSYNTYKKALDDLVEWGFVIMVERSKNQFSSNIVALSKFNKASDKALDKALIKHGTKQHESTDSIDKQVNKEPRNKEQGRGVTAPPPPLEDVVAYFTENGYTADAARKAWNYYNASLGDNGRVWKDGKGQTVKNWKQKMQAVWFKDENKIQQHTPRRLSF
jgi:hypothetical protein